METKINNIILTDVDDVLLSWVEGFKFFASHKLGRKITGLPDQWDVSKWLGLTDAKESGELIHEFNTTAWEFGCLPETANSRDNLRTLKRLGANFIAITCCSTNEVTVALRNANLYHMFGPIFERVHCLPLGSSKLEVLKQYQNENVIAWVEDKYESAADGKSCGYETFMIRCSHNRKHEAEFTNDVNWVDSWDQITEKLARKIK